MVNANAINGSRCPSRSLSPELNSGQCVSPYLTDNVSVCSAHLVKVTILLLALLFTHFVSAYSMQVEISVSSSTRRGTHEILFVMDTLASRAPLTDEPDEDHGRPDHCKAVGNETEVLARQRVWVEARAEAPGLGRRVLQSIPKPVEQVEVLDEVIQAYNNNGASIQTRP